MALPVSALEANPKLSKATRLTSWVSQMDQQKRQHYIAVTAILIATIIHFSPVLSGRSFSMVAAHMYAQYPWIADAKPDAAVVGRGYPQTDHAETFYPDSVFATNAVRSGQFPMWLPYSFGGIPILEVGIGAGLLYPPKLLAMLFLSPINQHDLVLFIHYLLAGLGMYAFVRCLGANSVGAVIGAIAWEFSGYNAFWLTMEHAAIASAWFPVMMLGAVLTIRRQSFRWAAATGTALGMAVLSGLINHVYVSVWVLTCWYAVLTAIAAFRIYQKGDRRAALVCLSLPLVSALVAIMLSAASWLGMIELLSTASREPETLEGQLAAFIPLRDFANALLRPESLSGPAGKPPDFAGLAFIGIPALILSPLGLLRRSIPVFFAAILCVISVAYASGFAPVVIILRSIPYFGAIHLYSGLYPFGFAIAMLAAFGVTEVSKRLGKSRTISNFAFGLGGALVAVEAWQLIVFSWTINPVQPKKPEWLFPETPVIRSLRDLQGEYRMLPITYNLPTGAWTPPVFAGKVSSIFNLRSGSGYESLLPVPTVGLWSTVEKGGQFLLKPPLAYRPFFKHDNLPIDLFEKLSVGLLVTPPGTTPRDDSGRDLVTDGTLQLVYQGPDGWIYKDARAVPRAFLVPRVLTASDPQTALVMLIDKKFDARSAAIVIGEQATAEAGLPTDTSAPPDFEATANIVSDRLNSVEVEFLTPRAAMMVLNDSWAPGWKAFVDGVEKPVLRVNYGCRGVPVPAGQHRVLFLYRPPLLLIGLALSGTSMLILLSLTLWEAVCLRRSRRCKKE